MNQLGLDEMLGQVLETSLLVYKRHKDVYANDEIQQLINERVLLYINEFSG